jgi:hypothetical protein
MSISTESLRGAKQLIKRGGRAASWAAVGEIIGLVLSVYVPTTFIAPGLLPHALATILGAIGASGLFSKFKTTDITELDACLNDANRLFLRGTITEAEHLRLRQKFLDKFLD